MGYLERLVQTAANPTEFVHPWTGPVAARYQSGFHDDPSGESAPSAAAMRSREENSDSLKVQTADSKQTSLPHLERSSVISGSQPTEIALAAETGQSATRGLSSTKNLLSGSFIANARRSTPDPGEATKAELARAKAPQSGLAHRGYDPVVTSSGKDKMELAANSLLPSAGKKDPPAVRNSAVIDRQADEIQIHIGRIEVTAVHPPAPRAPTTRKKEISLDAYLDRRGGRPT